LEGWLTWYAVADDAGDGAVLVGSVGLFGKPEGGAVEIGYSVLPEFFRRGYGAEMVGALADWALTQPGVERVTANVKGDNEPSIRLLLSSDFAFTGDSDEPEHLRFERWRDGAVMTAKPIYRSAIPADAVEYATATPAGLRLSRKDYFRDSELVGSRFYNEEGVLEDERAYRNDLSFGREYVWHPSGAMMSVAPFDGHGRQHGTAYQWAEDGKLLGGYTMVQGTGVDLWWQTWPDGTSELAEVHYYRDNERDGYEWWLTGGVPHIERHWQHGVLHGVEREWNENDRLQRGYPRFYVNGQRQTRARYLEIAATDSTLPPFREEDNAPERTFPPEVEAYLKHDG